MLIRGESAWSVLAELSKEDAKLYLDSRRSYGFNAVVVNLVEPAFSSHDPKWRNAEGELPFSNPDDFTTTNEAYFAHVDWFLKQAEARGIFAILAPAYLGYECGSEGWCMRMKSNGAAKLRAYGEYLGARYESFGNILWLQGGDYVPSPAGSPSELDLVDAVALGIRAKDNVHLHTAVWSTEVSAMEGPTVSWLDVDSTYSYTSPNLSPKTLADYARDLDNRPFFFLEGLYENEHHATAVQLRAQMYQPVLSGSTGFVFGNYPIWALRSANGPTWQFDDGGYPGGWKSALDGAGTLWASIAFRFLSSVAWYTLVPDTNHKVLVSGADSALCAADRNGALAVIYSTRSGALEIDLSKMRGPVTARWFDPSAGAYTDAATNPLANAGTRSFTAAANNAGGETDWVLLLEAD